MKAVIEATGSSRCNYVFESRFDECIWEQTGIIHYIKQIFVHSFVEMTVGGADKLTSCGGQCIQQLSVCFFDRLQLGDLDAAV